MARILAISSQVAHGNVGLSVIVPVLLALGHEVMALPTVLLSNHPGHPHVAGVRISPQKLNAMVDALAANGWLADVDAVLSGYLPTAGHAAFVAATVRTLRQTKSAIPYLCDPVIGDWPKGIYIDKHAAASIRDELVPLATMLTPNAFELGWLAAMDVADVAAAERAIRHLPTASFTVATSVPMVDPMSLANVVSAGGHAVVLQVSKRNGVPHGTGDLLAALICGRVLHGRSFPDAAGDAVDEVSRIISASEGHGHLQLSALPSRAGRWA
jgi:pyridoxine kinase